MTDLRTPNASVRVSAWIVRRTDEELAYIAAAAVAVLAGRRGVSAAEVYARLSERD